MHRMYLLLGVFVLFFSEAVSGSESKTISAVYAHNALTLSVPYEATHSGEAELALEVLSPEDRVLGHAEYRTQVAKGSAVWNAEIVLRKPMAVDELIWQRIRFTLRYEGQTTADIEEIRSLSEVLLRPVLHVLGQRSYIAGAQAAMRVIATQASRKGNQSEVKQGRVRIELLDPDREAGHAPRMLFAGPLDRRGSAIAEFRFPAGLTGTFPMRVVAETPLGQVETTVSVQLEDRVQVLLTSEKPIYQPSQTIHLRALALDRADHRAAASRAMTFEVEDSRGNKVFRKATSTDGFGVASAEFTLADEVNLGAYHVRLKMGADSASAAELTVNVERYVLPKFRVAVDFDSKDGKQKRDYRPGDHVTGAVKASYFFGKPVANAPVTIKASAMDAELFNAATGLGHTDGDGVYHFDLVLPKFFAGNEKQHGAAPVVVEATVKDAAEHAETRGEAITVSDSPLLITAIPEGGTLAPNLDNEIFILTSYPDGSPARTTVKVHLPSNLHRIPLVGEKPMQAQQLETDSAGVAVFHMKPEYGLDLDNAGLRIEADDHRGSRSESNVPLELRSGADQILLHTDRAVFHAGDRMKIAVLSTRQSGAAYVDLVHNGQTILTRDVDLENGRAELTLNVTPEMSGTLAVSAYSIGRNGREVTDQKLVFVQPAEELHIEAQADAASYLPGGEARVHIRVTNQKGEGVTAALGLEVVDQAVFALAEKQPGFAKVFFYLDQELMKPHYEVHSIATSQIVAPTDEGAADFHDRQVRVLFAAAETVAPYTLETEAGGAISQGQMADYLARYRNALLDDVRELAAKMTDMSAQHFPAAFKALRDAGGRSPHDAWGTELRIEPSGWYSSANRWYEVRSAGPDCEFNTADDVTVWVEPRTSSVLNSPAWISAAQSAGVITLRMEHDSGPDNGLAEIAGTVTDVTGAFIPGAQIQILRVDDGKSRDGAADAAGKFSFAALPPGHYKVRVQSPGFRSSIRTITLAARDRGVLSAVLDVGAVTQTVAVESAAPLLQTESAAVRAMPLNGRDASQLAVFKEGASRTEANASGGHVRSYFPEALYINPEVLTDGEGKANIAIPLADSITTWRMTMFASTQFGALGSGTSELKVFQDFFVDLDLPVTITQGGRITIPVAVYNYTSRGGDVELKLEPEDWFSLDGAERQSVSVAAGAVGAAQFTIEANKIGKFNLTLTGHFGDDSKHEDTVVREIEVVPNGAPKEMVFNGRLEKGVHQSVRFPQSAIPDASKIFVRLYPGPLSQVIEGMDGILRMPFGCFEQTSSSTYPNVLALDYMKRTKKLTPEIHAKAEGFIATGYQRLLTFEVPGGGFSWFGNAPANKILTAYGLMEFHDMAGVYDVDPEVIARTRDWLIQQQQPDGSWKPDTQFINEGATNRFNTDVLRITAYIAWALESAEYKGAATEKARQYIEQHLDRRVDAYTLAVIANFAVRNQKDSDFARRTLEMLRDAATEKGDLEWWSAEETSVYATGESAAVETTGLAAQAFLNASGYSDVVRESLAWITSKKSGDGNWGTTQATIMALRALLIASEQSSSDAQGTVEVLLNGSKAGSLDINKNNNDLLHQFVLPVVNADGRNEIELRFSGEGGMAYQIAGRYFVPWQHDGASEPLAIVVKYDRTRLAQSEIVTGTATIHNNMDKTAKMVMVDLGIPPGFELQSEDLQKMVERTAGKKSGRLEKFSMTATQAILYFDSIAPHDSFEVRYRLRAKYPIRAQGFVSRVYEYYDPNVTATATPVEFEVK